MIRLLLPEVREITELRRADSIRGIPIESDALPSRILLNQSLWAADGSPRAYRWSVPYFIVWEAEPRIVGSIGGKGLLEDEEDVELAYNVALAYRGRGIATRAIAEMRRLAARDRLGLLAHLEPENVASRRALIRNDFVLDGMVRLPDSLDLERWTWSPD